MTTPTPAAEARATASAQDDITLRRATGADTNLIARLLLQLGDRSRYLRYHVPWHMTRQAARQEAERMLARDGGRVLLVVVRPVGDCHEALAVGELAPAGDGTAELALVVRDDLQRRGIGSRLGHAMLAVARELGIRQVRADVLAENWGARRLLGCLGLDRQRAAGYGTLQFAAELRIES